MGNIRFSGVGRLIKEHDTKKAEFAILITDPWQGKGLGTELLKLLVEIGRREGLRRIIGYISAENLTINRERRSRLQCAIRHGRAPMEGRDRAVKVAVFSAKNYDREFLAAANNSRHEFRFFDLHLNEETVGLAARFHAVCVFVNDHVDGAVVAKLAALGVRLIALRCAGYNNVDLAAAKEHAITVVRVPGYSPYAVAEHAIGLILALNRNLHRAYNRVREGNFALDGLLDFIFMAKLSELSAPEK